MDYKLYITRAKHFYETNTRPITHLEWVTLAKADPSLRQSSTEFEELVRPDGAVERRYLWAWVEHSAPVPLQYADGAIFVKSPDKDTIRKLVALADKLNARVIGEESEVYGADGEPSKAPETGGAGEGGLTQKLRRWFGRR
jgi:hypothetical protein